MNDIFKIKRKLHYLVNLLFYFIIFLLGYFVGGGSIEKVSTLLNLF